VGKKHHLFTSSELKLFSNPKASTTGRPKLERNKKKTHLHLVTAYAVLALHRPSRYCHVVRHHTLTTRTMTQRDILWITFNGEASPRIQFRVSRYFWIRYSRTTHTLVSCHHLLSPKLEQLSIRSFVSFFVSRLTHKNNPNTFFFPLPFVFLFF
jgi:hypothetical protein